MNLACKAVLAALARTQYVELEDPTDGGIVPESINNPISTLRALIRAVS